MRKRVQYIIFVKCSACQQKKILEEQFKQEQEEESERANVNANNDKEIAIKDTKLKEFQDRIRLWEQTSQVSVS